MYSLNRCKKRTDLDEPAIYFVSCGTAYMTALSGVAGDGFVGTLVRVYAFIAQTDSLHFHLLSFV